jgi:hypothetical protein
MTAEFSTEQVEKAARLIKIIKLSTTPGMDAIAVKLSCEPTYNELQVAEQWARAFEIAAQEGPDFELANRLYQRMLRSTITREQAIPYIFYCVDDALSERARSEMPDNSRLVGWQCGFEPLFVAVWSDLDIRLDDDEAIEIATDFLAEKQWFAGEAGREADYVL